MRGMFLPAAPNKDDYVHLIRHCGWGTPDLNRALWSAGDSLTLLVEDVVHPYAKVQGKGIVTRDMNLHSLPWPKDELEALQDTPVEMRITLSYFIEPNPSARGVASKYHYPSHRLRFDVQRPLDASTENFVARVNAAAQREDEGDPVNPSDPNWLLGERQRHRGSLHQDVWKGTALTWPAVASLLCILRLGGGGHGLRWNVMACRRDIAWWYPFRPSRRTLIFTLLFPRKSLWLMLWLSIRKRHSSVPLSG